MSPSVKDIECLLFQQFKEQLNNEEFAVLQYREVKLGNSITGQFSYKPALAVYKRYTKQELSTKPLIAVDILVENYPPEKLTYLLQAYGHESEVEFACIDKLRRVIYHWSTMQLIHCQDMFSPLQFLSVPATFSLKKLQEERRGKGKNKEQLAEQL